MKGFFNIEDFKNSSNTNSVNKINKVNPRQRVIPQRVLDAIAQYKQRMRKSE